MPEPHQVGHPTAVFSGSVRGRLDHPNGRERTGWRYLQCTHVQDELKVLLPPRAALYYQALLREEVKCLSEGPVTSQSIRRNIRQLKDITVAKCQKLCGWDPRSRPSVVTFLEVHAPPDFRVREIEEWFKGRKGSAENIRQHRNSSSQKVPSAVVPSHLPKPIDPSHPLQPPVKQWSPPKGQTSVHHRSHSGSIAGEKTQKTSSYHSKIPDQKEPFIRPGTPFHAGRTDSMSLPNPDHSPASSERTLCDDSEPAPLPVPPPKSLSTPSVHSTPETVSEPQSQITTSSSSSSARSGILKSSTSRSPHKKSVSWSQYNQYIPIPAYPSGEYSDEDEQDLLTSFSPNLQPAIPPGRPSYTTLQSSFERAMEMLDAAESRLRATLLEGET